MFTFDLQLFAHKKGVSSTRNGRDSESKRLGVKCHDGSIVRAVTSSFVNVVLTSTLVLT